MTLSVSLLELRQALLSVLPHVARPNTPAEEKGLRNVRLQLVGESLLVMATDQSTSALAVVTVFDPETVGDLDPIDLGPQHVEQVLKTMLHGKSVDDEDQARRFLGSAQLTVLDEPASGDAWQTWLTDPADEPAPSTADIVFSTSTPPPSTEASGKKERHLAAVEDGATW